MNKTKHPLESEEAISNLVMMEEELINKQASLQTIQDLTKVYSDLIEYYESNKDPIKTYFMEKIQIILANKDTLKLLNTDNQDEDIEKYQQRSKISMNMKKELRNKMANFHMRMSKIDPKDKKQSIHQLLEKHEQQQKGIDKNLKKEMKTQEEAFNKKMQKRRERSINRSMSRSMEKGNRKKKGEDDNINTANILKHLDDKNDNPFEK